MGKIILSLFVVLWAFEAQATVYFIDGESGIKFSKQSYGCNEGWNLVGSKCVKNNCSSTTYPFSIRPENGAGTIISCKSGNDTVYGYSACNNGWTLNGGDCVINSCEGYPYSTKPDTAAGTIASCKSGVNDSYAYISCNNGWSLSSGRCEKQACDGYPYSSSPDSSIGTVSGTTCKSGSDTKYKYASCKTGWDLENGACVVHVCDNTIYLTTTCPTNATCATCYTGGNIKYASPVCNSGYELSNGSCVESCKYTATSAPSGCSSYDTCVKGGKTYYNCKSCSYGWYLNASNTCTVNDCSGYKASGSECDSDYGSYESCQSGDTRYCTYTSCKGSCRQLQNGKCNNDIYAGLELWEDKEYSTYACSPSHGTQSHYCTYTRISSDYAKCKFTSCAPGYYLENGMCWCDGNYPYILSNRRLGISDLAASYSTCTDFVTHIRVDEWRKIVPSEFGLPYGTPTWSGLNLYSFGYHVGWGSDAPMNLFKDFCEASGGYMPSWEKVKAETDSLNIFDSCRKRYLVYGPATSTSPVTKRLGSYSKLLGYEYKHNAYMPACSQLSGSSNYGSKTGSTDVLTNLNTTYSGLCLIDK